MRYVNTRDAVCFFTRLAPEDEVLPAIPEGILPIHDGDVFLLCTDSLREYVEEDAMERALVASSSAQLWLDALERELRAQRQERS